jgi:hypothetical protein
LGIPEFGAGSASPASRLFRALSGGPRIIIASDSVIFGPSRIPLAGLPRGLEVPASIYEYTRSQACELLFPISSAARLIEECAQLSVESHQACVDMVCKARFSCWVWRPYDMWFDRIMKDGMHPLWEASLFTDTQRLGRCARQAAAQLDATTQRQMAALAEKLSEELGPGGFQPFGMLQLLHQAAGLEGTTPLECLYWLVVYVTLDAGHYTRELECLDAKRPACLQQHASLLDRCRGQSWRSLLVAAHV